MQDEDADYWENSGSQFVFLDRGTDKQTNN